MRLNGNLVLNPNGLSEVQNLVFERVTEMPAVVGAEKGRFIFRTDESKVYYNDGTEWVAIATGGNAAALQAEVDALEAALGGLVGSDGSFNASALSGFSIVSGATTITEVLEQLEAAIAAETSRATTQEAAIRSEFAAADATLQGNIDAEEAAREAADTALQTALTAEETAREAADTALQAEIDAEEVARAAADTTLQGNIDAEASARAAADTTLQGNIDAEASARAAADTALQGEVDQLELDLAAEVTRATTAEAAIVADMQAKLAGLTWKNSVRALASTNVDIATGGLLTIDDVVLVAGDRVILNGQTDLSENGVYVVSLGAWDRATDMDETTPLNEFNSAAIFVESGTVYADTGWTQVRDVTDIGTDEVQFTQFNGAAGITAGVGLEKSGNTLSVKGDGSSITIGAEGVKVSDALTSAISANTAAIAQEVTDREAAVSAEAAARAAADTTLQDNIDAEAAARIAADSALQTALTAEETARIAADSALQAEIDAEEVARAAADAALQAEVDAVEAKLGKIYFLYNGASDTSHVIDHGLGVKYTSVTVIDSANDEVIIPQAVIFGGAGTELDPYTVTVTLNSALAIKVVVMAA